MLRVRSQIFYIKECTGATHQKKGIFELANKATLFLDEIDSASPSIQIKLLRVLETGELLRVGGEEMCRVDVRIITATNANLAAKVAAGNFREDLFYRLDVASLNIPPLRERPEDIELFIGFFLAKESSAKQLPLKDFTEGALSLMKIHRWPGNIRELSNTEAQALLLSKGEAIDIDDLPERIHQSKVSIGRVTTEPALSEPHKSTLFSDLSKGTQLNELLDSFQAKLLESVNFRDGFNFDLFCNDINQWRNILIANIIESALNVTYGNQVKAAKLLGITPRALRYHMQKTQKTSDQE